MCCWASLLWSSLPRTAFHVVCCDALTHSSSPCSTSLCCDKVSIRPPRAHPFDSRILRLQLEECNFQLFQNYPSLWHLRGPPCPSSGARACFRRVTPRQQATRRHCPCPANGRHNHFSRGLHGVLHRHDSSHQPTSSLRAACRAAGSAFGARFAWHQLCYVSRDSVTEDHMQFEFDEAHRTVEHRLYLRFETCSSLSSSVLVAVDRAFTCSNSSMQGCGTARHSEQERL